MNEIDKHLHMSVRGGIVIIELLDRRFVDTGHIRALSIALDRIVTNHPTANLVLAIDRVEKLSTTMFSALTALVDRLRSLGCELRLAGVSDELRGIFKMTKLDHVLALDADVETALTTYRAHSTVAHDCERRPWT